MIEELPYYKNHHQESIPFTKVNTYYSTVDEVTFSTKIYDIFNVNGRLYIRTFAFRYLHYIHVDEAYLGGLVSPFSERHIKYL